ncbi:MAG: hypothetical protein ACTSYK_06130 [Alphaproteobacteria bacterium]
MKILFASMFAFAMFAVSGTIKAATDAMYFATVDTVGNCSVSQGKPSAGQKALGDTSGYENMADAEAKLKEIRDDASICKGAVE